MNKKLLSLLLSFLFLGFVSNFAQEDEAEDIQVFANPSYQQSAGYSIFDNTPIYGSDWEWLHQTPQGNTLRWVKMWDANNWYAVGYSGTFLKTADAGATWTVVKQANGLDNNGSNENIYDAHFWDMNTGIVAGGYGTCYKTTDAGLTWDSLSSFPTAATCYDLFFVDDTLGFACGTTSMRIYKTTDGGNSWSPIWGNLPSRTCYQVYAVDENNIRIACSSGYFDYTTDGGTTWLELDLGGTIYDMAFTDPMNGWVCGVDDNPSYTTDGGLTWTLSASAPTTSTQYDIDILNAAPTAMATVYPQSVNYWTGTTDGATKTDTSAVRGLNTEDGWFMFDVSSVPDGSTIDSIVFHGYVNSTNWPYWSLTPLGGLDPLTATPSALKDTIQANSGTGAAYLYQNEGSSYTTGWKVHTIGGTSNADLQTALAQDWFAMGMDSRDNSATYFLTWDGWNSANIPYLEVYYSLPAVPTVFVTGDPQSIFSTTDMGTTWTPVSFLGSGQPWTSTYYSTDWMASNEFVTVGAFGLINSVNSADAIVAHTLFVKGGNLYSLWAESASGTVIAGGSSTASTAFDQAMYSTDGGDTWTVSMMMDSSDLDFNGISMVSPTIGYSAGEDYRVMKTTDGGASWFRVTDPVTSTSDAECVFFVDENIGYVFGVLDDGYKTTDGGTTWSVLTTGATATFYRCYFTDANTGWVVGASGTVLHTTDGGATFTPQDPAFTSTIYSIWMVNANVGYLSGSTGTVRKTTDGGTTWVDINPSSFSSQPTLYDIEFRDESNGMTVGSTGRTFFTNDGGGTWTFENTGMSTIYAVALESTSPDTSAAYVSGTSAYVLRNHHVIVPVELASFSASVNGDDVTLSWMTATELNNSGFQVERKAIEDEWIVLGFLEGKGTTTETQAYSFIDKDLVSGIYNYRIKQIDFDGTYKYFDLKDEVDISSPISYDLSQNYPNPFNPSTKIKYSVPVEGFVKIAVFNILGEKVAELVNSIQKAGNYELTFNASNFASGMYIYRMESGNFVSIKKMMILK